MKMMPNIAIVVSYGYSDFLDITIPVNASKFDNLIIVTKESDTETINLVKENSCFEGVLCWPINDSIFTKNGAKFNRGAVYNYVFQYLITCLGYSGWITLLDSDIIVPRKIEEIDLLSFDKNCFYGARRYSVDTIDKYKKYLNNPPCAEKDLLLYRGFGYGYLQMFHIEGDIFKKQFIKTCGNPYPESYDTSNSDTYFRDNWGKMIFDPIFENGGLGHDEPNENVKDYGTGCLKQLPFNVLHLGPVGVNNTERKSAKWVL